LHSQVVTIYPGQFALRWKLANAFGVFVPTVYAAYGHLEFRSQSIPPDFKSAGLIMLLALATRQL